MVRSIVEGAFVGSGKEGVMKGSRREELYGGLPSGQAVLTESQAWTF